VPKVTEEHRTARRSEILAAACRCFARDGFHATSIADIIAESGLSAGSVYLYFRSKDEIISAVVEMTLSTADELFDQLLADGATPSPEETVEFMVDAVMERAVEHPILRVDMSRVALHAWAEALRDHQVARRVEQGLVGLREHYAEVVRRWQAAGYVEGDTDPEQVGAVLLGIVHAFALQRLLIPGTNPIEYTSGLRALLAASTSKAPARSEVDP
jgi:AcrR family transcriptional regulator